MRDRRIQASARPALCNSATQTNQERGQGMGTRPVAYYEDGAKHPWFVGPGDQGNAGLAANLVVSASVPVLAIAGVMHGASNRAVSIVTIAAVVGVALRYRARWPLTVLVVALLGAVTALLVGNASPALGYACEIAVFTVACLRPPPGFLSPAPGAAPRGFWGARGRRGAGPPGPRPGSGWNARPGLPRAGSLSFPRRPMPPRPPGARVGRMRP